MRIGEEEDWSDRTYDLSFNKLLSPWLKHLSKERKVMSFGEFAQRWGYASVSSIIGQQLIFLLQGNLHKMRGNGQPLPNGTPLGMLAYNLSKTLRPTQRSFLLFTGKVTMDYLCPLTKTDPTQYQKAGILGLVHYLIIRPLDQIQSAGREIKRNQGKEISRMEGLRVVLLHDGIKGLYKSENILGPVCSALHRGIYFGLYHRLSLNFPVNLPQGVEIPLFSFLAALGASVSTFLPDKLRSAYLHVHLLRNTAIQRRGRSMENGESVTREVLGMLTKGELGVTRRDVGGVVATVLRGFVEMMVFQYTQRVVGWKEEQKE